jgi:hypothetical protein
LAEIELKNIELAFYGACAKEWLHATRRFLCYTEFLLMNDTPDKALPSEVRFLVACEWHGLTLDDVKKIGQEPGGQDVLVPIAEEAGITKQYLGLMLDFYAS